MEKMKKLFTILQLFPLTTGNLEGADEILNYIFQSNFSKEDLPEAYARLTNLQPIWFEIQKDILEDIKKAEATDDPSILKQLIEKKYNEYVEVPIYR